MINEYKYSQKSENVYFNSLLTKHKSYRDQVCVVRAGDLY